MLRARAELDSRPTPALIRPCFVIHLLVRGLSSRIQVKDRVLIFVLRAEVFPVFLVILAVDFEIFVRVYAAAVFGRPGRVHLLSLSFHLAYYLKSLHCLEGNEGCLEYLVESLYTHIRLWSVFL